MRFLKPEEYGNTIGLFEACFGWDDEFMEEYYGTAGPDGRCTGSIGSGDTAVIEEEGAPVSMVQVQYRTADYGGGRSETVPYIMGVCTLPAYRRRGYMDRLMHFVAEKLADDGFTWCFLIAVDREIYRHLGYLYDWKLSGPELRILYADDGLDTASACLLSGENFLPPEEIRN